MVRIHLMTSTLETHNFMNRVHNMQSIDNVAAKKKHSVKQSV